MTRARRAALRSLASVAVLLVPVSACDDPLAPIVPDRITSVVTGWNHTCALDERGQAFCWGDDRYGQLGARLDERCRTSECRRPVPVAGGLAMTDLALGELHTCGVSQSRVYCWGMGRFGQLGDGRTITELCRETPAFHCAPVPRRAVLGHPTGSVAAAFMHTCALDTAGRPYCWGRNLGGQLGTGDGVARSQPFPIDTEIRFETVTTGLAHSCGTADEGAVYCWGYGGSGRLGTGDLASRAGPARVGGEAVARRWLQVDAGAGHTCGVETNGTVSCWGLGNEGQLGLGDRSSRLLAVPVDVPDAILVSAGGFHSCAVTEEHELFCWGSNRRGQLGIGDTEAIRRIEPVRVPLPEPAALVSAGQAHTCAVAVSGSVYCWGANYYGQLGDGTDEHRASPVGVSF